MSEQGVFGAWQPIETAPKDGTWILLCRCGADFIGSEPVEVGTYDPYYLTEYVDAGNGLFRQERRVIHEWRGTSNSHRATHWMPVPELPK